MPPTTMIRAAATTVIPATPTSVVDAATHSDSSLKTEPRSLSVITAAVTHTFGLIDEGGIQAVIGKYRQAAADATEEEMAESAAIEAQYIRQARIREISGQVVA